MNLEAFKEGDLRFLVCTDVAARGIDIAGLPFVIQTTLPDDIENYMHRVGRCGRAERMGLAISLVSTEQEKVWYHKNKTRKKSFRNLCCGDTRLTVPFLPEGKLKPISHEDMIIEEDGCGVWYNEPDLLEKIE